MCTSLCRISRSVASLACCPCRTAVAMDRILTETLDTAFSWTFRAGWKGVKYVAGTVVYYPFNPEANDSASLAAIAVTTAFSSYLISESAPAFIATHSDPTLGVAKMGGAFLIGMPILVTLSRVGTQACVKGFQSPLELFSKAKRDFITLQVASATGCVARWAQSSF